MNILSIIKLIQVNRRLDNDAEEDAKREEEEEEKEKEDDEEEEDDDDDDDRQSEILPEHFNVELLTTNQLQTKPHVQSSNQPEVTIDGQTLRWPKFGIKNTIFKSK